MRVLVFLLALLHFVNSFAAVQKDTLDHQITFIIDELPGSTPHDASLYLAGSLAHWYPDVETLKFEKDAKGVYKLQMNTKLDTFEYKITRGSWKAVEGRTNGRARPNRTYISTLDGGEVHLSIDSWEDISIGSYSIYMIFLILSSFQGLLLIITINTIRNKNKRANSALTVLLILITLSLVGRASTFNPVVFNWQPKLLLVPELILFTYGPIFYYYIHKLLVIDFNKELGILLAILPLIHMGLYLPYYTMENQTFVFRVIDQELFPYFAITGLLALFYNSLFWFLSKKLIRDYSQQEVLSENQQNYTRFLNWVLGIKAGYLIIWASIVVIYLSGKIFDFDSLSLAENVLDVLWLLFSFIIFALAYYAVKNPEVLREKKKYKDQSIPTPELDGVLKKLQELMDNLKVYTQQDLTLTSLANQIPTSAHTLSRAINEHYQLSFSDYINKYRVQAFIQAASDSDLESYLQLAYQVGFNSKPTFNRAFKKVTGTTPRDYFKSGLPG